MKKQRTFWWKKSRTIPGGSESFSLSALSESVTQRVYKYREQRTLNLVTSPDFFIFTDRASFLLAVRRKSLISLICFGCVKSKMSKYCSAVISLQILNGMMVCPSWTFKRQQSLCRLFFTSTQIQSGSTPQVDRGRTMFASAIDVNEQCRKEGSGASGRLWPPMTHIQPVIRASLEIQARSNMKI